MTKRGLTEMSDPFSVYVADTEAHAPSFARAPQAPVYRRAPLLGSL